MHVIADGSMPWHGCRVGSAELVVANFILDSLGDGSVLRRCHCFSGVVQSSALACRACQPGLSQHAGFTRELAQGSTQRGLLDPEEGNQCDDVCGGALRVRATVHAWLLLAHAQGFVHGRHDLHGIVQPLNRRDVLQLQKARFRCLVGFLGAFSAIQCSVRNTPIRSRDC